MNLRKPSLLALAFASTFGLCAAAANAQTPPPRKTVEVEDARGGSTVVSVVGEITAIDVANRTVSIKGPKGNIAEMQVDPAVKNLAQVKVGDRVRLTYRIGVALALLKGGDGIREKVETDAAAVAAPGKRPGGIVAQRTTLVANVMAVDAKRHIVTLQGTSGQLVDVKVRDAKALQDVKVGDQVAASITRSLALRMQPAPAQ